MQLESTPSASGVCFGSLSRELRIYAANNVTVSKANTSLCNCFSCSVQLYSPIVFARLADLPKAPNVVELERITVTQSPRRNVFHGQRFCQRSTFRSAQKVAAPTGSFIRSGLFSKRPFSGMTCCPPCLAHQVVFPLALIPSTTKIIVMTTPLIAPSLQVPNHQGLRGFCRHPLMRQQLLDLARPLRRQACKNVFQISIRIMPVEPRRLDQTHDRRRPFSAA